MGVPLENYLWIPTELNFSDLATRVESMTSSNLGMFLGDWDAGAACFSLDSKFFGSFDVNLHLFGHSQPDEKGSVPGIYDSFNTPQQNKTMISILYSGAPIPSAEHSSASEYVLNKTITLLSLQDNNSTGSQVCHYSTVTGRNGLSISL